MPKPSSHLEWTVGNPDFATVTQEPTALKKQQGWFANEKPAREFMNWLFFKQDEWNKYFEDELDNFNSAFQFVVGSGSGMTADLATAITNAAAGDRILVTEDDSIDSTIQITKRLEIYFKPGVTYSKGSAGTGIEITADNVVIRQGRFTGFNGGSDIAIQVANSASHTKLRDIGFASNDKNIDDLGVNTTVGGIVNEDANEKNTPYIFSINNNQAGSIDLADLDFDETYTKNVLLYYTIHRRTDSEVKKESGFLVMNWDPDASDWDAEFQTITGSSGVEFFSTAAGQAQYTSDNMAGANYTGEMKIVMMNRFDL